MAHRIKIKTPRKVYPAVGRCIYCGSTDPPLTIEHIFPRGLAGNWELPESTCDECREKTGGAEQAVLRSSIGIARISLGFKSSKPKDRPKFGDAITGAPGTPQRAIKIPIEEYPTVLFLPTPPPPGILTNTPASGMWQPAFLIIVDETEKAKAELKYGPLTFPSGMQSPHIWARMLAKIAYSWVVAEKGYGSFTPFVTPIIRQETNSWSYYVGAAPRGLFPVKALEPGLSVHYIEQRNMVWEGRILIVVTVRLFDRYGGPHYLVVVGETHCGNDKFPPAKQIDHA
jgi:hypothetical protein